MGSTIDFFLILTDSVGKYFYFDLSGFCLDIHRSFTRLSSQKLVLFALIT